jgi:hypothetical protein
MTFSLKRFARPGALAIVMLIALCAPMAAFAQEPEAAAAAKPVNGTWAVRRVSYCRISARLTWVGTTGARC